MGLVTTAFTRLIGSCVGEISHGWFVGNLIVTAVGAITLIYMIKAVRSRSA